MPRRAKMVRRPRQPKIVSDADRQRRRADWVRASRRQLDAFPLCDACGRAAEEAHHVKRLNAGGALLDPGNLRSLCRACHGKIEYGNAT